MNNTTPWLKPVYIILVFLLTLTGFAQMPIFKRYYLADVPGLQWLGGFYFNNVFHYVLGALFLFLLAYVANPLSCIPGILTKRLTGIANIKIGLIAIIALTGILRVIKNEPSSAFGPTPVMLIDLTHLGSVMLFGMVSVFSLLTRKTSYLKEKEDTL